MKILSKRKETISELNTQLPKLNRVCGQLEGIKRMIEGKRSCSDILTQLRSVRGAIKAIESNLLNMYLKDNVCKAFDAEKDKENAVAEVCALFNRFEN